MGVDLTGDISDTAMLKGAVDCRRCVFTEPKRCDERLFAWLSTVAAGGWRWQLPLTDVLAQARAAFPKRGKPQQTNLCLCHLTRKRIIHRAQKAALRRERPAAHLALEGDAPLGQRTLYWPGTRHIACMAQSKQGLHNSMLLECVGFDAEAVTLRNLEGEGEFVLAPELCRKNLRSALAYTISSAQGRTIPGTIGLGHPRYGIRHFYTCVSRSRRFEDLSCED